MGPFKWGAGGWPREPGPPVYRTNEAAFRAWVTIGGQGRNKTYSLTFSPEQIVTDHRVLAVRRAGMVWVNTAQTTPISSRHRALLLKVLAAEGLHPERTVLTDDDTLMTRGPTTLL